MVKEKRLGERERPSPPTPSSFSHRRSPLPSQSLGHVATPAPLISRSPPPSRTFPLPRSPSLAAHIATQGRDVPHQLTPHPYPFLPHARSHPIHPTFSPLSHETPSNPRSGSLSKSRRRPRARLWRHHESRPLHASPPCPEGSPSSTTMRTTPTSPRDAKPVSPSLSSSPTAAPHLRLNSSTLDHLLYFRSHVRVRGEHPDLPSHFPPSIASSITVSHGCPSSAPSDLVAGEESNLFSLRACPQ